MYGHGDFAPPAGVRAAFKRGLELHADGKSGDGIVPSTVTWARRLANGDAVTPEKARKGNAWHARHAVDERPGWGASGSETPGYVAFMLWGGAPGRAWFSKLVRQMDAADAQESAVKHTQNDQLVNAFRAVEASITLKDGETLDAYRYALAEAAGVVAMQFLNDSAIAAGYDPDMEDMGQEDPDFRSYTDDAGADYIALSCSRSHPWMSICLRMTYTRAADGVFTFGSPDVVVPRRVYDPDPQAAASLSAFVGANIQAAEAVEKPSMKARKNLPAAAYAAPFYADADGDYEAGGTFVRSKSALPFHINTAKDVDATETVDVPRLRNALARFGQTDFARFGDDAEKVKATAKARLDAAAKAVLPDAEAAVLAGEAVLAKMPGAPTRGDVTALAAAHEAFVRADIGTRATEAHAALGRLAASSVAKRSVPATESANVQRVADEVLATAKKLGCTSDELTALERRRGAISIGRVHDVALGIV